MTRQMARNGDSWSYGTSPVEQRGARLKKFVRNVVCWRPIHDGWVATAGPAGPGGTAAAPVFVARLKYETCSIYDAIVARRAKKERCQIGSKWEAVETGDWGSRDSEEKVAWRVKQYMKGEMARIGSK